MKELKTVDFKYPEEVLQTKLYSCEINGQEIGIKWQSWSDLLIAITEWFIDQDNPKLASLESMPFYRNKMFFLPDNPTTHNLHRLSNGKMICVEYTPSVIVKIIGNLCHHCGVDLAHVVIIYEKERELRKIKSTKAKKHASTKLGGVDFKGNMVSSKEEKKHTRHHKVEQVAEPTEGNSNLDSGHNHSVVDFKHPEQVAYTNLISCKIYGQDITMKRSSWQSLLIAITEWLITQKNPQLASLENLSLTGGLMFFMQEKHSTRASHQLSNGKWVCLNYMSPIIIKIIENLCVHCGIDLAQVVITYEENIEKQHRKPEQNVRQTPARPVEMALARARVKNLVLVEFQHPERTEQTNPITCKIKGQIINMKRHSWSSLLVAIIEWFISQNNPQIKTLESQPLYGRKAFFIRDEFKEKRTHQLSNGKLVNIYQPAPTIVRIIGLLCLHCGLDLADVEITYKGAMDLQNNRLPIEEAIAGKIEQKRTRRTVKSEQQSIVDTPKVTKFQPILDILYLDYAEGFRFDYSYMRFLSNKANVQLDDKQITLLKKQLYQRGDNFYFLLDSVTDNETRKQMAEYSKELLKRYRYFELSVLYSKFASRLNLKCIRQIEDFRLFYTQKINPDAHFVTLPKTGELIVCEGKENVSTIVDKIASDIAVAILNEKGGSISEDNLQKKFTAFSRELLANIIKNIKGNQIQRCIINGKISYLSQEKNNLPDNFSEILSKALYTFDQLGLPASEEALHIALSQALGVNFKGHFGISSQKHYKRIITTCYKDDPPRKWKKGIFERVSKETVH